MDTSPKIEFCGYQFGVGEHVLCIHGLIPPSLRSEFFAAQKEGKDPISDMVKAFQNKGWDIHRLPYDPVTNPENERLLLVIHMDENNCITKTNPN